MNGLALAALLYVTGGAPGVVDGPDHEAGCYLGDFDGGETRVVFDGPAAVPFFVGVPGSLARTGAVSVAPGVHDVETVTVHAAEVYEVTAPTGCVVPDLHAEDVTTPQVVLAEGSLFVLHSEDCDEDGLCEAQADGVSFTMLQGTCEARRVSAAVPSEQLGWWVPAVREGVRGWVRGGLGFHVESRCVGPDEGARPELLAWHRV